MKTYIISKPSSTRFEFEGATFTVDTLGRIKIVKSSVPHMKWQQMDELSARAREAFKAS